MDGTITCLITSILICNIVEGKADLIIAAREPSEDELKLARKAGGNVTRVRVGIGIDIEVGLSLRSRKVQDSAPGYGGELYVRIWNRIAAFSQFLYTRGSN